MSVIIDTSGIMLKPVTVTFLEMHVRQPLPQLLPGTSFKLLPKPVPVNEYRKYYYGVGEKWNWLDRMVMPDKELSDKINAEHVDIFVFYAGNEAAGFIEFVKEKRFVEILYFGLLPAFIGKGWGKYFMQWVAGKAWGYEPEWIQLNTCTLDHPNALNVYMNAGFMPVRTEIQERRVLV
jgi:GNAT superfamily N-acetyltransferase